MGGKRLVRIAATISLLALLAAFADVALIASNVPKVPKEEPLPAIYDKPLDKPAEVPVYLQADERWGGLSYAGEDLAAAGCGLIRIRLQMDRGEHARSCHNVRKTCKNRKFLSSHEKNLQIGASDERLDGS